MISNLVKEDGRDKPEENKEQKCNKLDNSQIWMLNWNVISSVQVKKGFYRPYKQDLFSFSQVITNGGQKYVRINGKYQILYFEI